MHPLSFERFPELTVLSRVQPDPFKAPHADKGRALCPEQGCQLLPQHPAIHGSTLFL